MRCAQKFPRLLYFMKADDTPYLHSIHPGWSASQLERVTWNTEKRAIAAKITRPLRTPRAAIERDMHTISVEQWAAWAEEDAWLNSITMPILD